MLNDPAVTIGVPVRNAEKLLGEALDSILAQTFTDFEIVVSDNGSTDGTAAVAEGYAARDARVRVVRQAKNRGASWNFSHVLGVARGRYFKWAAADDTIAPTFLERTLAVLQAEPSAVLAYPQSVNLHVPHEHLCDYADVMPLTQSTASERFAEHRRRMVAILAQPMRGSHPISNAIHGLARADVLRCTACLAPYVGSDGVLLGELALYGTIVEIPEQLMALRQHGGSPWAHDGTVYDVSVWLDPANASRFASYAPTWAALDGYLAAVHRAPLGPAERAACMATLFRTTSPAALIREASVVATRCAGVRPWNKNSGRHIGPPRAAAAS